MCESFFPARVGFHGGGEIPLPGRED